MSRRLITNCPNCAGVLKNGKCEYCDTQIIYPNSIDIFEFGKCEITLQIKREDNIYILPLRGRIEHITRTFDTNNSYNLVSYDGSIIKTIKAGPDIIDFSFCGIIKED